VLGARGRRVPDTQCPGAAQPSYPALLRSQVQGGAGEYRIPSVWVLPNPPTQPYSAPRYREGQPSIGYPVSGCGPTLLPSPTPLLGTGRGRRVSDTQCPGAAQPSYPTLLLSQVQGVTTYFFIIFTRGVEGDIFQFVSVSTYLHKFSLFIRLRSLGVL
jgi:hypothetical protein